MIQRISLAPIAVLVFLFMSFTAHAEIVTVTAKARVAYDKMSSEVQEQAEEAVQKEGLKKVTRKMTKGQKRLLKKFETEFYDDFSRFVVDYTLVKDKDIAKRKQYSVIAKVSIDTEEIENFLSENSEAGNQGAGEGQDFGVLVVARAEQSRKSFKAKTTDVSASSSDAVLKEESASDGASSVESASSESLASKSSGGSVELKSDSVVYEPDVTLSDKANTALSTQFSQAGFEFRDLERLAIRNDVPLIEDLIKNAELADDGTLPKRRLFEYQDLAMDEGWTFLGYAVLDVGVPRKDPTSGSVSVTVSLNMRVWMLEDDDPIDVAAVQDKVFEGLGSTEAEARALAINQAGKGASESVIGQLQVKGLY